MNHKELIELMARALCGCDHPADKVARMWAAYDEDAQAALQAIQDAGSLVLNPEDPAKLVYNHLTRQMAVRFRNGEPVDDKMLTALAVIEDEYPEVKAMIAEAKKP